MEKTADEIIDLLVGFTINQKNLIKDIARKSYKNGYEDGYNNGLNNRGERLSQKDKKS